MAKIKVPTVNDLVKLTTDQIEAMTQLPSSMVLLNQTLTSFAQTVGRLDKLVKRLDRLTEPLEEPLTALAPRLQALVPLLDEELMSSLPGVLDSVRRNAVPALEVFGQTQAQVASIAASVERLMHLMDDTFNRLQDLPGVNLVNRLRGASTDRQPPTGRARSAGRKAAASKATSTKADPPAEAPSVESAGTPPPVDTAGSDDQSARAESPAPSPAPAPAKSAGQPRVAPGRPLSRDVEESRSWRG